MILFTDYIIAGVQTGVLNKVAVSIYNCFYKKVKVKPLRRHQVPILISWIKYLFDFCIFSNASAYLYVFIYLYASHYLYLFDL